MNLEWIRESCALNAHWWIDSVYLLMDSVFNLTFQDYEVEGGQISSIYLWTALLG
jgi:hypothetical protein